MAVTTTDSLVSTRMALSALLQGDAGSAERTCQSALQQSPNNPELLSILGAAHSALEHFAEARQVFSQLIGLQPNEAVHWINLGTALRGERQLDEALAAYARAASLGAASAEFFDNIGLLHLDRGDYESAMAVLARAVTLAPDDAEICLHYAHCCNDCQQREIALSVLESWPSYQGLTTEIIAKISLFLLNLGEPARAEQALQRAAADPQPTPQALLKLAQIFERTNRVDEASQLLRRLKTDPKAATLGEELLATEALVAQRVADHETACQLFAKALAQCKEFHLRHVQLFPYAKSLDALRHYDQAFAALIEAHRSQVSFLELTSPLVAGRLESTIFIAQRSCDRHDIATWKDEQAPSMLASPVFIVAFPRSGTTLLEQVLDAHPLLKSMDEQPFLQNAIDRILEQNIRYPAQLGQLSGEQLQAVRSFYWQQVRTKLNLQPGQRLVDKNPLNILRLPAIRRLFPNARIVLAVRHPCDVILSCFMQHFTAPEFVMMCRDLSTLASGYRQAFDFWYQQVVLLNPAVHELRYETFVTDFDNQVQGVAEFLQLPWDDAMLAPAAHARAKGFISTPSYSQVVQPVNTKSIGKWQQYETHFAAAMPLIEPYLQRWGYDR